VVVVVVLFTRRSAPANHLLVAKIARMLGATKTKNTLLYKQLILHRTANSTALSAILPQNLYYLVISKL
jgi:hypothetical protein